MGKTKKDVLKKVYRGEELSEEELEEYIEYMRGLDEIFQRHFERELREGEKWEMCLAFSEELGIDADPEDLEIVSEYVVNKKNEKTYKVTEKGLEELHLESQEIENFVRTWEEGMEIPAEIVKEALASGVLEEIPTESPEEIVENLTLQVKTVDKLNEIHKVLEKVRSDENLSLGTQRLLEQEILDIIERDKTPIHLMELDKIVELAKKNLWAKTFGARTEPIELKRKTTGQKLFEVLREGESSQMEKWLTRMKGLHIGTPQCPVCMRTPPFELKTDEKGKPIFDEHGRKQYLNVWEHFELRHESEAQRMRRWLYFRQHGKPYPEKTPKCPKGQVWDEATKECIPKTEHLGRYEGHPVTKALLSKSKEELSEKAVEDLSLAREFIEGNPELEKKYSRKRRKKGLRRKSKVPNSVTVSC